MQLNSTKLPEKANMLRRKVLEMCYAHGGHISTCYSCVEILTALYYGGILKFNPNNPKWDDRDLFIMSKGHGETILYALLADLGFFPAEWTETGYRSGDCRLGGHIDHSIPGIEVSAGALGHGLGLGCGLALAAKADGRPPLHVVLLGDAECSEGSVWEAALFAAQHKLGQLVAIIDRNGIGSLDYTDNYIALEPFADKWRSFGWDVVLADGHDFASLFEALPQSRERASDRPLAVIARTVKGKGVSLFENDPIWHVRPVTSDIIEQARKELRTTVP